MPGLLLDLDGTIADTFPHLFSSFRHAVRPFAERLPTDAEIVATFGPAERGCIAQLLPGRDSSIVDEAATRFHAYYEDGHAAVHAFPGIPEVIHFARENGWYFGVCTGKSRRSAQFTLEQLNLWETVELLIGGDDVDQPKPDPEGVLLALKHWRLATGQLLVVGDAPADVLAGNRAGVKTGAAMWGAFDREATRAAGPTWAFDSPSMLRGVVEGFG